MIVWGGMTGDFVMGGSFHGDGDSYDPATDTWTPISPTGAPRPRGWHSAVWTGTEMIVWGGANSGSSFADGAIYR